MNLLFQLFKNEKLRLTLTIVILILVIYILNISSSKQTPTRTIVLENPTEKIDLFFHSIIEKKVYSQNNEDGVILSLIKFLKLNNGSYVEFGVGDGSECNTRHIRESFGWKGLWMDGYHPDNLELNHHKENILYSNIVQLFDKYNVKIDLDLVSVDTDYSDFWIVEAIIKSKYKPKIVIHEVNQQKPNLCVAVPKPGPSELIFWDVTNFHGGSVCAFYCLAKTNDYTMVKDTLFADFYYL